MKSAFTLIDFHLLKQGNWKLNENWNVFCNSLVCSITQVEWFCYIFILCFLFQEKEVLANNLKGLKKQMNHAHDLEREHLVHLTVVANETIKNLKAKCAKVGRICCQM